MTLPALNNKLAKPKTHILLTYAGSKHFITTEQEMALRKMSDSDRIYTDRGMVRVSTIKEILPVEEYYIDHPEERPEEGKLNFTGLGETIGGFGEERRKRAINNIISGFKEHFGKKQIPESSQYLLNLMIAHYNT